MTEAERERPSRNLAEVIDDLYRQHAPPRDHERLIQLVQVQIRHAMSLAERSARLEFISERGGEAPTAASSQKPNTRFVSGRCLPVLGRARSVKSGGA
jgi:hypothetical protein